MATTIRYHEGTDAWYVTDGVVETGPYWTHHAAQEARRIRENTEANREAREMDTVTQSNLELDEAFKALDLVEATLTSTNHYANGPVRLTREALEQLREDLEGRRAYWAEVEDMVEAAADEARERYEQEGW